MALLIDSSIFIAIERAGNMPPDFPKGLQGETVALAAITASELLHGVHRADSAVRRDRRQRFVEAILSSFRVLPFDLNVARVHSGLWADLQRRGSMIGSHDLLIAATAMTHDFTLLTRDRRDFGRIEGLDLLFW